MPSVHKKRKVTHIPFKTLIYAYIYMHILKSYIYIYDYKHTHSQLLLCYHHFIVNVRRRQTKKWPRLKMEIASEVLNLSLRIYNRDHQHPVYSTGYIKVSGHWKNRF